MQTEYEVFCLVYFVLFAYNMQVVGKIIIIYIAAHTHVCLLYQIITEAARADAAAIYGAVVITKCQLVDNLCFLQLNQ